MKQYVRLRITVLAGSSVVGHAGCLESLRFREIEQHAEGSETPVLCAKIPFSDGGLFPEEPQPAVRDFRRPERSSS